MKTFKYLIVQKKISPFKKKKVYNLMSFLQKLWSELNQKRKLQHPKQSTLQTEWKQVYPGFRTIPIQVLDSKLPKAATKKDNKNGVALWGSAKRRILTYQQNVNITHPTENGFFSTFYEAYMNHGDIKITPDQIWLAIMLWFTKYVDENSEKLRKAFVTHTDKKTLIVHTMSADINEWDEFFDKVIEEIRINTVKGVSEKLECNFSSTNRFERLFSTAIIMNTFKKYVNYQRQGGMCGIQNIHMSGNIEDWIQLKDKLGCLVQFDVNGELKKYVKGLTPVLDQFIQTYKGHANIEFWNNIYQERVNPPSKLYIPSATINGWLIKFFTTEDQIFEQNELTIERITVNIKYVNLCTGQTRDVKLLGGCKGYAVEEEKVYRPHFSFVITESLEEKTLGSIKQKKGIIKEPIKEPKRQFIKEAIKESKKQVVREPIKLKKSPYQEPKKENKQMKSKTLPKGTKKK